ncbi:hypothetical protein BT96DRAFT_780460, partial [Gymnopus androsaceus JB14]
EIVPYFNDLSQSNQVLNLGWFLEKAECIVDRYMSLNAFEQALSAEANESAPDPLKFPVGDPYSPPVTSCMNNSSAKELAPSAHEEQKGFTGNRVLTNSILFKTTVYSWWIEASYAIPKGDIGWLFIFIFAGSGNSNYTNLLLEMYCLFCYESSKNLKDAIWNNWLVNVTGELGKWIPNDLLQEHYNQWFEDLLLAMYFDKCIHLFCFGHSMGFAALNLFNHGCCKLMEGGLQNLLDKHTLRVEILQEMEDERKA